MIYMQRAVISSQGSSPVALFHLPLLAVLMLLCCTVALSPLRVCGQRKDLQLEQVVDSWEFYPRRPISMQSSRDGKSYTTLSRGNVLRWSYATGKLIDTVFSPSQLESGVRVTGYEFNGAEDKLLVECDARSIYRRSYTARYYVFDLATHKLHCITPNAPVQQAHFLPSGEAVSYVWQNNLYVVNWSDGRVEQVTSDGVRNQIINGAPDWVYEEEFALTKGYCWSEDGRYLAYLRFDESEVREFSMPVYADSLYPVESRYKYPKAGERNSTVTVWVYDRQEKKSVQLNLGSMANAKGRAGEPDYYVPRIDWVPGVGVEVIMLDRLQRHVEIALYAPGVWNREVVYSETENLYIEELGDSYGSFLPDGRRFIVQSERNGFRHIYLCDRVSKNRVQLTRGGDEVCDVYGVDPSCDRLYYRGYDGSPLRTAVFSVNLQGKDRVNLSVEQGTNRAQFNSDFSYFSLWHSDAQRPLSVSLLRIEKKGRAASPVRILEDNAQLRATLQAYAMPRKEFFSFITSDGVSLNGYRIVPHDFDSTRRYPVLMYQYSGPGSQSVVDEFSVGWDEFMVTRGVVIVCVDGRGTGGRGEAFKKCTYGKLGDIESHDQIEAGRWLQKQPWVDGDRIGIWGWSYGGYMSSLCLMRAPEVFCMAISVAPVTSWRFYDTIYTERYMGLPQGNDSGYDDYTPLHHAAGLKGDFLLVHGTRDDNVHYQHSMRLVEKLVEQGKQFEMAVYPDRDHFIRGGGAYLHLHRRMQDFAERTLALR